MMSKISDALLEIARRNTAVFQENPHIKAILVTGSVAKGLADDNSDIDIIMYYDELPGEAAFEAYRQAAFASGDGFYGGEVIFLQEELLHAVQNIFGVLCGLNNLYYPGKIKGLNYTVAQMQLVPPNVTGRLPGIFEVDGQTAVTQPKRLIEETIELVETHLPHINTVPARNLFTMQLRK